MSDAEEVLNKDPCADFLRSANICVQNSPPGICGECFNTDTFNDAFPRDITQQFLSAMSFVPQTSNGFCGIARERVCVNYAANQACCCQEETAAFRVCAFNKVLMPQVGWIEGQCTDNCGEIISQQASSDSGDGSMGVIAVLVAVIFLLLGAAGVIMYRRREARDYGLPTSVRILNKNEKGYDGDETRDIVYSSQSDEEIIPDIETPSPRSERKVTRQVSNIKESDDDSSLSASSEADFKRVLRQPESEDSERPKMVRKISKVDLLKEKRKAIEAWNADKKRDSQRSHSLSFLSSDEDLQDGRWDSAPRMPRSSSNRELSSNGPAKTSRSSSDIRTEQREMDTIIKQLKTTRKGLLERVNQLKQHTTEGEANGISSRQMNSLMKDRAESTLRLSQLDDALEHYQHRMEALDAEAKVGRKDRKSKETAKLSMSASTLDIDIDDDLAKRKTKEKSDRHVKRSSSSNNLSRSESDESNKEKRVKTEESSRNPPRRSSNDDPSLMEKQERRKSSFTKDLKTSSSGSTRDLKKLASGSESEEKRVKKEGSSMNLHRRNSCDPCLVEKRESEKCGSSRNLPRRNSSDPSLVEKRERRKSGSSRDVSREGSEASLVEKRERRKSGSSRDVVSGKGSSEEKRERRKSGSSRDLSRQDNEASPNGDPNLVEKRERRKSGSSRDEVSGQGSRESSPNSDKRERRKSGSSRDLSRQSSEASPKKKKSSRASD